MMSSNRLAFVPPGIRVRRLSGWVPLLCVTILSAGCSGSTKPPAEEPVPMGPWWKVNGALTAKCNAFVYDDGTVVLPNGQLVAHMSKGRHALAFFAADGSLLSQVDLGDRWGVQTLVSEALQRIVVAANDGNSADIYSIRFNGTDVRQVSRDYPRWFTLSPDGKTVAYVTRNQDGVDRLYTVPVEGGEPTLVPLGDDKIVHPGSFNATPDPTDPRFSADSQHVLYLVEPGTLYSSKIDGSARTKLSADGLNLDHHSSDLIFESPPGSDQVVYYGRQTQTVYAVGVDGNEHRELIYTGNPDCRCAFSPGASDLMVVAVGHLHRVEIASGATEELFPSLQLGDLVAVTADSRVIFEGWDASRKRNFYVGGLDGSRLTPLLEPWERFAAGGVNDRSVVAIGEDVLLVEKEDADVAPVLLAVPLSGAGETPLSEPAGLEPGESFANAMLVPASSGPPRVVYQTRKNLPYSYYEAFSVRLDGTGHTALTPESADTNEGYLGARGDVLAGPPIGGVPTVLVHTDPNYESVFELFAISAETGEITNLSALAGEHNCGDVQSGVLTFSPEGAYVAYAADARTANLDELYVAAVDGSRAARVSPDDLPSELRIAQTYGPVKFTDRSDRLVFQTRHGGLNSLWSARLDGSHPLALDRKVRLSFSNVLIDDARGRVAYLRYDEGTTSVHRVSVTGGAPQQLSGPVKTGLDVLPGLALLPDGSGVVYLVGSSRDGIHELHLAAMDGSGSRKLADLVQGVGGTNEGFSLAPDGKHVVVTGHPTRWTVREFFSVSLAGDGPVRLTPSEDDAAFLSFSRDSRWVAFRRDVSRAPRTPYIVAVATGDRVYTPDGTPWFVGFTADSSKGVFGEEGRVRMVELATGEVTADVAMTSPRLGPNARYVYGYVEGESTTTLHRLGQDGVLQDLKQQSVGFKVSDDGTQILLFVEKEESGDYQLHVMRSDGSEATEVPFPPLPVSAGYPSNQNYGLVPGNRHIWVRGDLETEGVFELFAVPSPLVEP